MTRILPGVGFLAVAFVISFGTRGAVAGDGAPWCAVTTEGTDLHWDCEFQSAAACQPYVVAGNRGFCNRNPYYRGPAKRTRHRRAK
jgi:hypothetical protein